MKNITLLSIILASLCVSAKAQSNGKADLRIVNPQQKPLSETFVELLNAKDSSLVQFAITDKMGLVEFKGLQKGSYMAFIPEIGSKNYVSYLFNISNYDEAYDITLLCKLCTEITIVAQNQGTGSKRDGKIG